MQKGVIKEKTREMKQKILFTIYGLLQCTWGLPQTLLGAGLFLTQIRNPQFVYRGTLVTEWQRAGGISLGLFLFYHGGTPELLRHEYGHTLQSLLLGPLYLPLVGLPSLLWSHLGVFRRKRAENSIPYSALFCESWADRLGARHAKNTAGEQELYPHGD